VAVSHPARDHLTCREVIEFLLAYLNRELAPEVRGKVDWHLARCPSCVAYLATYQDTVALARGAFGEGPLVDLPDELVASIVARRQPTEPAAE
jgi:anti-sigma factor RsiW